MDTSVELGVSSQPRVAEIYFLNTSEQILGYWPEIVKRLDADPSLWNNVYTKDSILQRALEMHLQFWFIESADALDCILMTQVYQTDVGKTLQCFWAYGEKLIEILPLVEDCFNQYALVQGATRMEVIGRGAWTKLFKPLGYEVKATVIGRDVRKMTRN